ncbi:MAG: hypothetical protein HYR91_06405 [Flavobacteriia bacterium]|nr:hypothetical protein [Flavobacteriia bacterium]
MQQSFKFNFLLFFTFFFLLTSSNRVVKLQQKDGELFVNLLKKKEGILNIHTSNDSINIFFDQLLTKINEPKSMIELYKLFGAVVTKIECGHTSLFPSKNVLKEWVMLRKSLPIDYVLIGNKLFVKEIEKDDEKIVNLGKSKAQIRKIPKNSELISIDGQSVSEMMCKIGEIISSDENGKEFKYFQASQLFEFYRNISFDLKDSVEVVYSEKKDTSKIYLYTGIAPVKSINKRLKDYTNLVKKQQKDIGKFSILKNKYAHFKFISFKDCRGKKYEEFLEKSFKEIEKKKIKKLIVDLRGNNGGQMQFSFMRYLLGPKVYLGKYVVNKPFVRFDNKGIAKHNEEFRNHKKLSKQQAKILKKQSSFEGKIFTSDVDKKLIFKGDIIVITDEGTFSAASILACHLKTLAKAKIVGHTAGGSFYKGNAGTLSVILPYTKFVLTVNPNTFWSNLIDSKEPCKIKEPDLILDPISPKLNKKDEWYLNKACKAFK